MFVPLHERRVVCCPGRPCFALRGRSGAQSSRVLCRNVGPSKKPCLDHRWCAHRGAGSRLRPRCQSSVQLRAVTWLSLQPEQLGWKRDRVLLLSMLATLLQHPDNNRGWAAGLCSQNPPSSLRLPRRQLTLLGIKLRECQVSWEACCDLNEKYSLSVV